VLARLKAASRLAGVVEIADRNILLNVSNTFGEPIKISEIATEIHFGDGTSEWKANPGWQLRRLPGHNRDSGGPLARGKFIGAPKRDEYKRAREWDRKVKKRSADTKAFLAQHDGADGKQGTFDLDDLIERCRKRVISYIRKGERFTWARLCAIRATFPDLKPSDRNAEQRHDEAMSWIDDVEDEPAHERARQIVVAWLRSGQSQGAFADAKGLHRQELRRIVTRHCELIGRRHNTAISAKRHAVRNDTLVVGFEAIAKHTGLTMKSTLRLIEGGKHVAALAGEPVALRKLLPPASARRRTAIATQGLALSAV
jgi:hypothetical protein